MNVPVEVDPLGTLGAGYVTYGLILAFDALLEPPGTRDYLTNWVSGTHCEFNGDLTMDGASIINEGAGAVIFNPYPQQQIDGHEAFGLDYSVDICVERPLKSSTGSSSYNPWGENDSAGYRIPGFQISNAGTEGFIRTNTNNGIYAGGYKHDVKRGERVSAHLEYGPT